MINFAKKPLVLAPMAGFSDLPFRSVVKKFGADFTISEMISANALVFENKKTLQMLEKDELENPFIVQIAGSDEGVIKKAVSFLNKLDYVYGIDFNCGCPVPKVVKQNAGAALLENLSHLKKLVSLIKENAKDKSVSVKFRLGFNEDNAANIALACEEAGADYIAIHGRTRKQFYEGKANWHSIANAVRAVKIPVIANGDIDEQNAKLAFETTGANALMIGRASVGKPWIFFQIKKGEALNSQEKKTIILYHFEAMMKHYGARGVSLFRKHLHQYCKGYEGASSFRNEINQISDETFLYKQIESFFTC